MPDASWPFESAAARPAVRALESSQIRAVANAGIGDPDVLPFWFGEPDDVTPQFIRAAAIAALERGETFYTQNFGIPSCARRSRATSAACTRRSGPSASR
jgi:aspartate/methionine/tyrosine aminotransferase